MNAHLLDETDNVAACCEVASVLCACGVCGVHESIALAWLWVSAGGVGGRGDNFLLCSERNLSTTSGWVVGIHLQSNIKCLLFCLLVKLKMDRDH